MQDNKTELKTITMEELLKKKSSASAILLGVSITMLFLIITLIYLAVVKDKPVLLVVATSLSVTILPSVIYVKKILDEIKRRGEAL